MPQYLYNINTKYEGQSEASVLLPSKIPLLGYIVKKNTFDDQSELLIFITPTIIVEDSHFSHRVEECMERVPMSRNPIDTTLAPA